MTKIILIGGASMAPVLAALQAQGHNVSIASERDNGPENHSVAGMLEGLHAARDERTAADYSMDDMNAAFQRIFGHGIDDELPLLAEIPFVEVSGGLNVEFTDPSIFEEMFGMTDEEYAEAEAKEAEQMAFARAYDALMRMLDVFSQVSGYPVTTEQRIAMTLMLSNDDTAEAFATAAEDLIGSGLFE